MTHHTLQRFLERAKQHGTRVCFVAFPTINCLQNDAYELRPETNAVLQDFGAGLIDLRQVSELTEKDYADKLHLNEEGRAIYTRRLAKELKLVRKDETTAIARVVRESGAAQHGAPF